MIRTMIKIVQAWMKWTALSLLFLIPLVLYIGTVYASGSEYRDGRIRELGEITLGIAEVWAAEKGGEQFLAEIENLEEDQGKLDLVLPRELSPKVEISLFESVAAGDGVSVEVEAEELILAEQHRVLPLFLSFTGTWEGVRGLLDRLRKPSPKESRDDSEIALSRRIFHWTELSLLEVDPGVYEGVLVLQVYFSGEDPDDVDSAPAPSRPEVFLTVLRSLPSLQRQVGGGRRGRTAEEVAAQAPPFLVEELEMTRPAPASQRGSRGAPGRYRAPRSASTRRT